MSIKSVSSLPEVFCKKGVFRNTAKFTGKHLCQSLFFNKVAGLRTSTLLKKRLWHRYFPVSFAKFLRRPFLMEHLRWLLRKKVIYWNKPAPKRWFYVFSKCFTTIYNRWFKFIKEPFFFLLSLLQLFLSLYLWKIVQCRYYGILSWFDLLIMGLLRSLLIDGRRMII